MRKSVCINIFLVLSIVFINELHLLFKNDYRVLHPFICTNEGIDIAWFTKFLCEHVTGVLKALLIYRLSYVSKYFRVTATAYLFFTVFDLLFFFMNFNSTNMTLFYLGMFVVIYVKCFYDSRGAVALNK